MYTLCNTICYIIISYNIVGVCMYGYLSLYMYMYIFLFFLFDPKGLPYKYLVFAPEVDR